MCETKEEISITIIDDLIKLTADKGFKIPIQDIYDLKNLFYFFDIKYMKQNTVEESKLIFIIQCISRLIKEKGIIFKYNYETEVLALKKYLPLIVDIKLINPKLLKHFNEIYSGKKSFLKNVPPAVQEPETY